MKKRNKKTSLVRFDILLSKELRVSEKTEIHMLLTLGDQKNL